MKDDYQFNEKNNKYVQEYKFGESGFPPRSTIHDVKDEDAPKNDKLSKIVFSAFGFLIVIAIILFLVFGGAGDDPEEKDPTGNGSQVEEPGNNTENPPTDPDDIIIEEPEEPPVVVPPSEPTPPETLTPPATTETTHTVKAGETLFSISQKYYGGGYFNQLAAFNNIDDPAYLTVGTVLKIPNKELLN